MQKYIIVPEISTSVVIAGLATTAGSCPRLFTIIGNMTPKITAKIICKANAKAIAKDIIHSPPS